MSEATTTQTTEVTTQTQEGVTTSTETKTLTMDEVQKLIQSETDKVRTEYSKKLKSIETEKTKIEREKMTEEERRLAEFAEKEKAIAEKEALFLRKELELKTVDFLSESQLPVAFKDFLLGADEEVTKNNIKAFQKAYKAEIEKAVNERLKGKTPVTSTTPNEGLTSFINSISEFSRRK